MILRIRQWLRRDEGATAVEFSMVAVPFVFLIVGTIEMALMFTAQSVLQESTFTAARLIRTGQIQQSDGGDPEAMFREQVCGFSELMIPCNEIKFRVQTLPSFADAADEPSPFDADGVFADEGFDPGGENDIVMIRVAYNYPIRTPLMQNILANYGGNKRAMLSTIVLQTEPYQ